MHTVKEIAKFFNVSPRTVYRKIESGDIDTIPFGRSIRITPEVFEQLKTSGIHHAPECNFSPSPKKSLAGRKKGIRPWEK